MTQAAPLLAVRGISKRYGEATVLDDVGFDLSPGEILGIIGPNGAGKTTLMECLVGLLAADGGSVSFGGMPVPPERRREAMFYLPDGIAPWSDQPVWRVTGLFRAPYADRWKLAFDARKSADSGIVIGAHACALTASAGTLVTDSGPAASLVGVQCNR